jgi:hypothetical protein
VIQQTCEKLRAQPNWHMLLAKVPKFCEVGFLESPSEWELKINEAPRDKNRRASSCHQYSQRCLPFFAFCHRRRITISFTNNHQPKSQPLPFRLSFSSRLPKMSLPYVVQPIAPPIAPPIVLQCVFFFGGLSCTKSCSNACFSFLRFAVHQIVQSVLLLLFYLCSENDKYGKTKNERFCIVFLIGAWARIWPQPGQPPKPRRTLNHYCI